MAISSIQLDRSGPAGRSLASSLLVCSLLSACPATLAAADPPAPNQLEVGAEERIRTENWDNLIDFSDGATDTRHQVRYRTRLWGKLNVGSRAEAMLGLNNESRKISSPDTPFRHDETIVETLYLDWRFSPSLSVKVGRQNLVKGDGFLVLDGTPLDGSRTGYFNAVDLTWTRGKRRFELLGISNPGRDQYLPRIDDAGKLLVEWDETAVGLGYNDSHWANTTLDGYWFLKTEKDDSRPAANAQHRPDRTFQSLGGRLTRPLGRGWTATGEAAGQFGRQSDPAGADIRGAWAAQAFVRKSFDHPIQPVLLLGWTGLSGDNPKTGAIEGWDPIFSRWPKWSELYIYTQGSEQGVAYWTNINLWQAELQLAPIEPLSLRGTWYHMRAFHPFPGRPEIYGGGTTRGDLFEARADLKINDHWRGHLLGEWLSPGSFYAGSDGAWFLRAEVIASFRKIIGV